MRKNKSCGVEEIYSKGFTLIELLAVIVILAIIALIATPIVLGIIDDTKKSSVEAAMKNIEKAALLEYSDLTLTDEEKEEIIYNCYDGKCTYNGKVLNVKGDMPDRGRIIVNEDGATFENIIIKGYNCIKENNKFTCNNTGLTKVNGTSILIDNNKTTEIENYRIYGNSIQNGTPTPDVPVDIESVGDLITLDNCLSYGEEACGNVGKYVIPIKVTGKNLWNTNIEYPLLFGSSKINVLEYDQETQIYTLNNAAGSISKSIYKLPTLIPKNTKVTIYMYVIQGNISGTITFGGYHYGDKKSWQGEIDLHNYNNTDLSGKIFKKEIETTDTVTDLWAFMYTDYKINTPLKFKILYKIGKDNNDVFEPYKETITNIYLDEPLRSIGEYSDYIDFKTKKVVRNIKEITLDGSENWIYNQNTSDTKFLAYLQAISNNVEFKDPSKAIAISNRFSFSYANASKSLTDDEGYALANTTNVLYLGVLSSRLNSHDLDGLKQYLKENPLTVAYLINQEEESLEIPSILLNKDTSVISVNTSVVPSNIELEYYK